METLQTAFPIPFYLVGDVISESENNVLVDKILSLSETQTKRGGTAWFSGKNSPKTNFEVFGLHEHKEFNLITEKVTYYVNNFAKKHNSLRTFEATEGWYNVYTKENYQEFHIHPLSVFSAVYYATFPKGSSPTIFQNPVIDMFPPFPCTTPTDFTRDKLLMYPPGDRTLVIFRSFLHHMVPSGTNESPRITLAYNFA